MHPALDSIRLIICDLDGTLINSLPDLAAALDRTLHDAGLPKAGELKVSRWIGNGTRMLVKRGFADAGMDEQQIEESLDDWLEDFNEHYARHVCEATYPYEGVLEFLHAQKEAGRSLAIVTNKPAMFVGPILETLGMNDLFDVVLGGDELPVKKPDPAPLHHVCDLLGINPEHCLMIGDSRNDIQAAKAVPMRSLAVSYGYNHGESIELSDPDWIVESLDEVV